MGKTKWEKSLKKHYYGIPLWIILGTLVIGYFWYSSQQCPDGYVWINGECQWFELPPILCDCPNIYDYSCDSTDERWEQWGFEFTGECGCLLKRDFSCSGTCEGVDLYCPPDAYCVPPPPDWETNKESCEKIGGQWIITPCMPKPVWYCSEL